MTDALNTATNALIAVKDALAKPLFVLPIWLWVVVLLIAFAFILRKRRGTDLVLGKGNWIMLFYALELTIIYAAIAILGMN